MKQWYAGAVRLSIGALGRGLCASPTIRAWPRISGERKGILGPQKKKEIGISTAYETK